jgi:hypothetical protein
MINSELLYDFSPRQQISQASWAWSEAKVQLLETSAYSDVSVSSVGTWLDRLARVFLAGYVSCAVFGILAWNVATTLHRLQGAEKFADGTELRPCYLYILGC